MLVVSLLPRARANPKVRPPLHSSMQSGMKRMLIRLLVICAAEEGNVSRGDARLRGVRAGNNNFAIGALNTVHGESLLIGARQIDRRVGRKFGDLVPFN